METNTPKSLCQQRNPGFGIHREFSQEDSLCACPGVAITSDHKPGGFKQQELIVSWSWRPDV